MVAYQLAVALDDALMGITQVVRGRDILTSTPRQLALLRLWGFEPPAYAHIPLLLDEMRRDGRLRDGQLVALSAFGAGLTHGAALLRI